MPTWRCWTVRLAAVLAAVCVVGAGDARAQQRGPSRQVTVFGILASPHDLTIDPDLKPIESQLRKYLPNHGFQLVGVRNKRLVTGEKLECTLADSGFAVQVTPVDLLDGEGKVQLRFNLEYEGITEFATIVKTPPNQLSFCEKMLPGRERLLLGVGAR